MSFSPPTDRSLPCGCPAHAARAQRALAGGRYWLEGPSTPLWGRFWRRRTGLAGWRPLIKHLPPRRPPATAWGKGCQLACSLGRLAVGTGGRGLRHALSHWPGTSGLPLVPPGPLGAGRTAAETGLGAAEHSAPRPQVAFYENVSGFS